MKYHMVALILQVITLVLGLVALGIDSYVYHYDRQWYRVVIFEETEYFDAFLQPIFTDWQDTSAKLVAKYGPFDPHHRVRTSPLNLESANFLRHPKTEFTIFLVFLILTVLMQVVAVIITLARKIRFMPRPCRENGWWHFIIGVVALIAVIAEIVGRLQVNAQYDYYGIHANSSNPKKKTGALMLASCGPNHKKYESQLSSQEKAERDDLYVCQRWWFFIACVVIEGVSIILCFIVAVLLCLFWRKKKNVEDADAEEEPKNPNQNQTSPAPQDNKGNESSEPDHPPENNNNINNPPNKPGDQPDRPYQQQPNQQQPNQQTNQQPYQQQPSQQPYQQPPNQQPYPQQPNQQSYQQSNMP